ncbi:YihY/virulence factor BrkB family protein [Ekhidna sp.]|uniref:YihY/virulence factor BrkB family protein n=1 Tax=Ekhidna sp. TaxID=2608089 RepID=UPI003CCBD247
MKKKLNQVQQFIEIDLWRLRLRDLPKRKRYVFGFLRIWVIAIKEFIVDKCAEKASALTYLSMLSLVPVLALLFAIAKAFGIRGLVESELELYFKGQTEVLEQVIPFVENILSAKGGGIIAVSSAVFLLYTVIRLLMNIEEAFNDMWDIKKSRRWERKISDYVAVILLGPILMIVASTATVFVKDTFQQFISSIEFLGEFRTSIIFFVKLIPYTILWILLFGLYLIFPNTRVKFFPALLGGIIAGTLYVLNQQAFISLQFAFARYDAIYGSLAFIPLFLIWLQISWLIVLFGAEICYGAQFMDQWEMNSEKTKLSLSHRKKLTLLLLYRIVKKFEQGKGPMSLNDLGSQVNVPRRYVVDICDDLDRSGLITRVENDDTAYQPSFDIHKMDIYTVLDKYEKEGMKDFDPRKSKAFVAIEEALKNIEAKWQKSDSNVLLKDL